MVFEPETIARLKKKKEPVTPIEPPKEELPEFEPETVARARARRQREALPDFAVAVKQVYGPQFAIEDFETLIADPDKLVRDLRIAGQTPETETILSVLGITPEQIEEFFAPEPTEIPTVPEPPEIPEGGLEFVGEVEGIRKLMTLNEDYTVEVDGEVIGVYRPETGEISPQMMVTIDNVRQLVTVADDGKVYNEKGQWVGTYNRATQQFNAAKADEGWFKDNVIDPWNMASNRLGHNLTQFGSGVLANIFFRDLGNLERKIYGDEWVDTVNAGNEQLRDRFREVHAQNQRDFDKWVVAHPELIPKPKYEEGLSEHWELLLDPGYFAYEFSSTAPISLSIMAVVAGGVITGNVPLGIMGAMAIMTPAESADAYEALLDAGAPEDEAAAWGLFIGTMAGLIESFSDLLFLKVIAAPIAGLFRKEVTKAMADATIAYAIKKGVYAYSATIGIEVIEEILTLATSNAVLKIYDENKEIWDDMVRTAAKTFAAVSPIGWATGASTVVGISRQQSAQFTDAKKIDMGWVQDSETKQWFRPMTPEEVVDKMVEGGVIEAPTVPVIPEEVAEATEAQRVEYTERIKPFKDKADAEIKRVNDAFMAGKTSLAENQAQRDAINAELDKQADIIRAEMGFPVAKPPVAKKVEPEIPEVIGEGGIPVPPEEPIPQGVVDSTPIMGDIGAKELVRPVRKVFERLGLYEDFKGIQRAEVLIGEERVARQKEQREVMKSVGKNKERWSLIFDEVNEKGSVVGLTFNEKRAVTYIRNWANEWADRKNLPKEKRIKDYIPHLFEQEMTAEIKETGKISPELAMLLSDRVAKHITDPFLKERLGAVGFLKDPFRAMEAYDAAAMRVFYYEPFLQKIAAIGNDPMVPHAVRDYMKDYSRRMTGEPSKLDMKINADLLELASKLKGLPGGTALANYLEKGNVSGLVAYQFTGAIYALWLGFKPTSAIRNLSQHTLIIGETGPVNFAKGIGLRFTKEGKQALSESLVLRSRKAAFVPGIDDSFAEQWTDKFRETALYMFRLADRQNVSDAFLAGYAEGKAGMPDATREELIARGDEVAADTQYLYTKMNSMAISQSSVGRVFSILTTWSENWVELMSKWIARRPSQVYLAYEKRTGQKVSKANWAASSKAILMYMAIIGLGYALKEETRLKAWEYTGITSIRYLADVIGGDFPGLQGPGAIANMVAGFITDDDRMFKEGWYDFKSTFTPGIIRQLNAVMAGDKDWLTLLLYLEGRDWKLKKLKNEWKKDFAPYNELPQKDRKEYRENNPKIEAKLFITSQFTTLSSDEARAEVLRLIEQHDLDVEMIDGYEKVFGVDTAVELDKFQNRVGNLEKLEVGVEAEYFTMNRFASEVNTLVKNMGRTKVEKDGNQLAVEYLRAKDLFVQYDSLETSEARKQYRLQFSDVEASLYLWGRISAFLNPNSAVELLRLMKKYDIPPEGIKAFVDDPAKYDALQAPLFQLQLEWNEMLIEYDLADKWTKEFMLQENPKFRDARRQIEAINKGVPEDLVMPYVEYYAIPTEGHAQERFLMENDAFYNEVWLEMLGNQKIEFDKVMSKEYEKTLAKYEALETTDDRQALLEANESFRKEKREREAWGLVDKVKITGITVTPIPQTVPLKDLMASVASAETRGDAFKFLDDAIGQYGQLKAKDSLSSTELRKWNWEIRASDWARHGILASLVEWGNEFHKVFGWLDRATYDKAQLERIKSRVSGFTDIVIDKLLPIYQSEPSDKFPIKTWNALLSLAIDKYGAMGLINTIEEIAENGTDRRIPHQWERIKEEIREIGLTEDLLMKAGILSEEDVDNFTEQYVEYFEIPSAGYANERWLMEHTDFLDTMIALELWEPKDFSKVPTEKFEEAFVGYDKLELGYDRYEYRGNNPWFDEEGVRIGRWDAFDPELFIPRNIKGLLEEYDALPTTGKDRLIYRHNHPELEKWFVEEKGYTPVGDRWKVKEEPEPKPQPTPKPKPKPEEEPTTMEEELEAMREKLKKLRG